MKLSTTLTIAIASLTASALAQESSLFRRDLPRAPVIFAQSGNAGQGSPGVGSPGAGPVLQAPSAQAPQGYPGQAPYEPGSPQASLPSVVIGPGYPSGYGAGAGYPPSPWQTAYSHGSLDRASWTHTPLPPPPVLRLNDLVTIRVSERAISQSEGSLERRKTASYSAVLSEWIKLVGLKAIKPAEQEDGDPTVKSSLGQALRSEGDMETTERLEFNIAATVADIRPNGTIVLEARRRIRLNNENWEYSLTGICRKEDILPNNTVLSEDIAELDIFKRERGAVRDSYRRGWFTRWFDQFQPF